MMLEMRDLFFRMRTRDDGERAADGAGFRNDLPALERIGDRDEKAPRRADIRGLPSSRTPSKRCASRPSKPAS